MNTSSTPDHSSSETLHFPLFPQFFHYEAQQDVKMTFQPGKQKTMTYEEWEW